MIKMKNNHPNNKIKTRADKKRVALITIYNPGAAGMRYVAGSIKAAGHEASLISFKELRSTSIPSDEVSRHKELKKIRDVLYIVSPFPGKVTYLPYPTLITDKEKQLLVELLRDQLKVDLVGFSFFSVTHGVVKNLTEDIHEKMPGVPVIWGGLHCIVAPEECIGSADIVCTGEGEESITELLERWDEYREKGALNVPGLWFRKPDGEIVRNPDRPLIQDMDSIPFPVFAENEYLIDDNKISDKMNKPGPFLNAHVYTFTERGCPYKCTYCIHSILKKRGYKKFRRRSVDNVLEEVRDRVERLGMKHLIFHDEIFIINKKWISEFAEKFRTRFHEPHGITFTGYVHPMTTDAEMLDMMVKAGLSRVGMGIQSGSERINKEIFERVHCPEESVKMAEMLSQYDFEIIQYDLLVNNPFEEEEDRRQSFELLMRFPPPFSPGLFGIAIYKHSKLGEMKPPREGYDEKACLFWNMLYHLTGMKTISRENIRRISENPYYREHPRELEQLVVDMYNAESRLLEKEREMENIKTRLACTEEWIKSHESESYQLKSAVKKKIKRLLYPIVTK